MDGEIPLAFSNVDDTSVTESTYNKIITMLAQQGWVLTPVVKCFYIFVPEYRNDRDTQPCCSLTLNKQIS